MIINDLFLQQNKQWVGEFDAASHTCSALNLFTALKNVYTNCFCNLLPIGVRGFVQEMLQGCDVSLHS